MPCADAGISPISFVKRKIRDRILRAEQILKQSPLFDIGDGP